jgi:hypothetical protein
VRIIPNRDYRFLVAGGIVSELGDWAARLALALLVFERTGSATAVGLTAALLVLPWLGPGQWLAAQGDRLDRRRLLFLSDAVRGALFLVIGLTDLPLGALLPLVALAATIDPVFEANRAALLVDVVSKEDYADGIQFNHVLDQGAQVFGYVAGGVLVAWLGSGPALAVNGVTFLASALLISAIRRSSAGERPSVSPSLANAWRFLRADRLCLLAAAVTAVTLFASMAVEAQAAVYGSIVAGLSGRGVGLLAAAVPLATLVGVMLVRTAGDDEALLRRGLLIGAAAGAPGAILLGVGGSGPLAFGGYAAAGLVVVFGTTANIVVGRRIPDGIRASTFAVLQGAMFVAVSLGAVAGGLTSDLLSPQGAGAMAMALACATCAAGVLGLRRLGRSTPTEGTKVPV